MKLLVALLISTVACVHADTIEIGSPPTTEIKSLTDIRFVAAVMSDYELVNGTVAYFTISTTGWTTPIWLQIWRPEGFGRFRLIDQIKHFPRIFTGNNGLRGTTYKVYPGRPIVTEFGDRIGFLNEGNDNVLAHEFLPLSEGTQVFAESFDMNTLPAVGQVVEFPLDYNVWRFGMSVGIDTEYGPGTAPPVSATPSTPSGQNIGNEIRPGQTLNPGRGSYILTDFDLPGGTLRNFHGYATGPGRTVYLQIWRPTSDGGLTLVYNQPYTPTSAGNFTVKLETPVKVEDGDKIGFTNPELKGAIAFINTTQERGTRSIHRPLPDNGSTPSVGETHRFNITYNSLKFSFAVDVDPDTLTTGDPVTSSPPSLPTNPIPARNVKEDNGLGVWLAALIAGIMALVTLTFTCIALCYVRTSHKKKKEDAKVAMILENQMKERDVIRGYNYPSTRFALPLPLKEKPKHRESSLGGFDEFRDGTLSVTPPASPGAFSATKVWSVPRDRVILGGQVADEISVDILAGSVLDLDGGRTGWNQVAVKSLKGSASDSEKHMFLRELELMKTLPTHPNVLKLLGCCTETEPLLMIVERIPYGSLLEHLRQSRDTTSDDTDHEELGRELVTHAHQIASGMAFLASNQILHRDLAARHVLLGQPTMMCKITHFASDRDVMESHEGEKTENTQLPVRWMAPETLLENDHTFSSDVWSFGVLLWEIFTLGATPHGDVPAADVLAKIREGGKLECPTHCSIEICLLMGDCWVAPAADRPTFDELVVRIQDILDTKQEYIQSENFDLDNYIVLGKGTDRPDEIL